MTYPPGNPIWTSVVQVGMIKIAPPVGTSVGKYNFGVVLSDGFE
jgi:hypothetical protein